MYFEGMKSVGECEGNVIEVSSEGGNLIDINKFAYNTLLNDNQSIIQNRQHVSYLEYIPVKPNTEYKYILEQKATNNPYNGTVVHFYDYNKNIKSVFWISDLIGTTGTTLLRIPSDCYYVRFTWNITGGANTDLESIKTLCFKEGANAIPNEPHQSNTQQLTHEPLRAVGSIKDRYVLIDGKWFIERNCQQISFTNNINYQINSEDDTFIVFQCTPSAFTNLTDCSTKNKNIIVDKKVEVISISSGVMYVKLSKDIAYDVESFKNYLPINLIIPVASPTYEPIDYNPFEVYSEVTHLTTNSTIPCNVTVKNHGYNCILKPSTTYTISSNLGLNTVTTPSTLTEDCLRFMDTDTSDVTTMRDVLVLEGDWTTKADLIPANFSGIESAFEQQYDTEKGKYKVNIKVVNEDKTKENNITFYINEPLRGIGNVKDKAYVEDDKVVIERNCGIRPYEDGDFGTYPTDKINTVYPLAETVYEEVEYNDTKLFIESFKNSTLFYNSKVPVTSKLDYSYSVPIVDTVAQTANVTDQQDQLIINLATEVAILEMMTL